MGDSLQNMNYDARVVQTVRNLKKLPSRHSDNSDSSVSTNNQNVNSSEKSEEDKEFKLQKSIDNLKEEPSSSKKESVNKINPLIKSHSNVKRDPSIKEKKTKILIDGNKAPPEKKKTESNKNLASNKNNFSSNFTSFNANNYKTKSEFQKRLMGENNIIKYKTMCIGLLKDDEELKKLCEICGFSSNLFENLLDEYFFSDKVFLYKLEVLLSSDSNLNKLKKEKFFKEEIKNKLEFKSFDIQYEQKINRMNNAIDNHIKNIQNFDFFK